MCGVPLRLFLG